MEERDNFWYYIVGLVIVVAVAMWMVKRDVQSSIPYAAHEQLEKQQGKSYRDAPPINAKAQ